MGVRRGLVGIAVMATALSGVALGAGAATAAKTPSVVASKAKKKKPVAACKLLTVAEITQALGSAPTAPPKTDSATDCEYSSASDYNFLNISLRPVVSATLWAKSAQGAGATVPVTGIGDAAFRSPTNATIIVRKGKTELRIDQYVQGLPEAPIESLGKAATARLTT